MLSPQADNFSSPPSYKEATAINRIKKKENDIAKSAIIILTFITITCLLIILLLLKLNAEFTS